MPIIKARSSSIINSVDLRGVPTVATAASGASTTQIASTAFVTNAVAELIDSSPEALDTLRELAAALGDDADFATTVSNSLAAKLELAGGTMTGSLYLFQDPQTDAEAATKKYVDDSVSAITLNSTDDLPEGVVSLYFTEARARASISLSSDNTTVLDYDSLTGAFSYNHPTSDGILEGTTNLYYTTSRVRNDISLNSDDAQILSYSSSTGGFTWNTPSTDKISEGSSNLYFTTTRARQSISAGANISYDPGTGIISSTSAVDSVNGQTGVVVLDTDNIDEGSANLYFTNARARSAVSLTTSDANTLSYNGSTGVFTYVKPDSDGIAEGSVNLYFTNARARTAISVTGDLTYNGTTGVLGFALANHDTDDLAEGAANLYFTEARARSSVDVAAGGWNLFTYDATAGEFTLTAPTSDDVTEGSTNLYFTPSRVRTLISATGDVTYDDTTGIIDYSTPDTDGIVEGSSNLFFTNARARSAVSAVDAGGDGSFSYDSATGAFTYTGPSASEVRAHFSAGTGITLVDGTIATAAIPNSSLVNSSITVNGTTVALGGSGTLDTDDIGEGTSNLYWTAARFDAALATKTTTNVAEGTNLYFTNARARGAVSAVDAGGDGSFSYDSASGAFTYTGPSATEVRAHFSAGTGVDITNGVVSIGQAVGTSDNVTFADISATGNLTVSGDLTVNGTLTTINSTDLAVTDKNITIADGAANAAAADGAGITVDGANATITYSSGTDSWNFNKGVNVNGDLSTTGSLTADTFTGDFIGDVTGNVTGQVSDISNHDTDALAEGSTNLYFTNARARDAISVTGWQISYNSGTGVITMATPSTSDVEEGTNLYFTNARAQAAISVSDAGGDGSLSYADGVITYTGPSATEVRAHFSAGTGISITNGVVATSAVPNASLVNSSVTINGTAIALGGSATFDSDDIGEGSSNLYFTDGRARSAISLTTSDATVLAYDSATGAFTFDLAGIDTDEVAEGAVNQYFTTQRARDSISATGNLSYDSATGVISFSASSLDTDDIAEGSTNLYFTEARVWNSLTVTTDNTDALSWDALTGSLTFSLATVDTDEIAEGATNFYFTTTRARNALSAGANINYDAATGIIGTDAAVVSVNGMDGVVVLTTDDVNEGSANLYFTEARAQGAITLVTDNPSILGYAGGTGTFTFVTPDSDAIAEGSVNLYYTEARVDARIAAASVFDLSDVDSGTMTDGYTLVWSGSTNTFVPQNISVTGTTLNFTGDGTATSFNTQVEVSSIENTTVFINGLVQAPTYSYTLSTVAGETSIVFDTAPEANDYIMVRVTSTSQLTAGGVLNESSTIDGGTF